VIGVFNAQHPDVDAFPESRRKVLEALGAHLATAIENARLFQHERLAKQQLEESTPMRIGCRWSCCPESRFVQTDFLSEASGLPMRAVGGDWYDCFVLDEHRVGVVLGDVSGKGMPAALLMASSRSTLRQQAKISNSSAEVLNRLKRYSAA